MFKVSAYVTAPRMRDWTLNEQVLRKAEREAGNYVVSVVRPQLPIKTGQLRRSYYYSVTESAVRPKHSSRWDSKLLNSALAEILDAKGYIHIRISAGHKSYATKLMRGVLERNRAQLYKNFSKVARFEVAA